MMKKMIFLLFLLSVPGIMWGQIIADHTVVNKYDDIPQYYIDKVKSMRFVVAGESHALGILWGLDSLELINNNFQVQTQPYVGTPYAYTTSYLRAGRAMWGDLNNETGWIYGYGEEDWWTSELAIARTKAGILYCKNNSLTIDVLAFGMCYDMGVNYSDYLTATKEYIDYCKANNIGTKVIFSTGTVDALMNESQWIKSQAYEMIRDTVKNDPSRILFDYADILCYDNDGNLNTMTWDGHTFPYIADENVIPTLNTGHLSAVGAVRVAKAVWWLLARMAGWDGITSNVRNNESSDNIHVIVDYNSDEIRVQNTELWMDGIISLSNIQGYLIENHKIDSNSCTFNKSGLFPGVYFVTVYKSNRSETEKFLLIK